jgi:hypothetical protein
MTYSKPPSEDEVLRRMLKTPPRPLAGIAGAVAVGVAVRLLVARAKKRASAE